jgi:hypothetical protein
MDLDHAIPPSVMSPFISTPTESALGPSLISTIAISPTPCTVTPVTDSDLPPDKGVKTVTRLGLLENRTL